MYGISGTELLAKLFTVESGFNPGARNEGSGATGGAQFMYDTNEQLKAQFGIDAWSGDPMQEVQAAIIHLTGQLGHNLGLEGYNPLGGPEYVQKVLDADIGGLVPVKIKNGQIERKHKGPSYPLGKIGEVIGTPFAGTHTIGNWQSDNAVDIAVPTGTPVLAIKDGVIGDQIGSLGSSNPAMAGERVYVNTPNDSFYYAHLSKITVEPGQQVKKGDIIGYTGEANGVEHLHLGVQKGDPTNLIENDPALSNPVPTTGHVKEVKSLPGFDKWLEPVNPPKGTADPKSDPMTNLVGLDTDLAEALIKAGKIAGVPIQINEGKRTRERQEHLYATDPDAAPPGSSPHESGNAVDIKNYSEVADALSEAGLVQDVPGEAWHWALAQNPDGGEPGTSAPVTPQGGYPSSSSISIPGFSDSVPAGFEHLAPAFKMMEEMQRTASGPQRKPLIDILGLIENRGSTEALSELLGVSLTNIDTAGQSTVESALERLESELRKRRSELTER
jgi:murein DD-endopeptidase MepM/ murein hydrolase activator NlpD